MANPTTNYGFVMPTSTDLVTDLPADFGVFGQAVDTQMLTNANAAIAKTIVDAKGDLIAATAADTVSRLAVGANNTVLTADSTAATGMKWAAPAGGGKVLQVVSAAITTATTIATTTMTDTAITLAITPTSATSKILVIISANVYMTRSENNEFAGARLLRDATAVVTYSNSGFVGFFGGGLSNQENQHTASIVYLDSPATTSATTYKVQGQIIYTANGGTSTWQRNSNPSTITLMEIGA
jgi:hypothetical protein